MNFIVRDKALFNTFLNQLWRIVSGPLTLVLIPICLTPVEQGYWYTFISLSALAIFADLGFSNIVVQFVAHEFAFCSFDKNGILSGDEMHLQKIADLFRFCIKWMSFLVVIVFPCILLYGVYILNSQNNTIDWVTPWLIYGSFSGLMFIYTIVFSFFEGCNLIEQIQFCKFKIGIGVTLITLIGLLFNLKLYTLAASYICSVFLGFYFINKYFRKNIKLLWNLSSVKKYSWSKEFFSLLWRYAISFSSSYFITQAFTLIAFHFANESFAGRVGISLTIWAVAYNISNSFILSNTTNFNILVGNKNFSELNKLFKKSFFRSIGFFVIVGILFFGVFYNAYEFIYFFKRFISPFGMFILYLSYLLYFIVNSINIYVRSYKKEPMSLYFLFQSIYVVISSYYFLVNWGENYFFLGFLTSYIFILPIMIFFYIKYKKKSFE